jgi:hypothetical protein
VKQAQSKKRASRGKIEKLMGNSQLKEMLTTKLSRLELLI